MFPLTSPKIFGRFVLAAALTFSLSTPALAQSSDAALVATVPAAHAPWLITQPVDMSRYELMQSGLAPGAERLKDLGAAPADMKMTLQLEMRRSEEQQKALDAFKQHAGTPGDSGFGATMTPAEFASAFGLPASDLEALTGSLRDAGFTLGNIDNGRLTLNFSGTVWQVNAALLTQIHLYEDADGVEHYGPVDGWSVPEALSAAIAGIQGLDNFSVPSLRSFNGPVVDFAPGTTEGLVTSAEWPKTAPAARLEGELLHDASFTASRTSMLFGGTTRLNIRIGGGEAPATGSLEITDREGTKIAYIADITVCEPYNNGKGRSCTLDYTPAAAGRSVLSALYSGDENYRAVTQSEVIAHNGSGASVTVASYSPVEYLPAPASTAGTIYTSISWLGAGTQPTGMIVVESNMTPTDTFGTITLPAAGATTIASGTACTTAPLGGAACTYGCTGSLTSQYITCTITNADLYTHDASGQTNVQQAVYSGDTNYATSTGTTEIYKVLTTPSGTPTISASAPTPATITYGAATTESNTLTITGNATQGVLYTAALAPFAETTNPQLGTMGEAPVSSCTLATGVCAYTNSFVVPANANPGSYTVTYSYSGKGGTTTGYFGESTTGTIMVSQQAPSATMVTPRGAAGNQENDTYGALIAFTLTGQLAWTGTGAAPTASDVTFTSSAPGSFGTVTCTGTTSPYSCSALYTPTATDTVNTYAINLNFSGDTNYSSAVSAQTQNYSINKATPTFGTMSFSPAAMEPYGNSPAITISDTLAYTGSLAPTGNVKFNLNSTNYVATCTGSSTPLTCTATVTAGTIDALAVGGYTVTASSAADANYTAATGTSGTFTIAQAGVLAAMSSPKGAGANQESEVYGALSAFAVSGTLSWASSGTVPTVGDISFTSTAAGSFGTVTCTGSSSPYTCSSTFTPTSTDAVNTYGINISFSGDTNYSSGASAQTANYAITQASVTAAMVSPTFAGGAATQAYGADTAVSVSGKVTWTGNGAAPTAGDMSFTSTAAGAFTGLSCPVTTSPITCTATFTPTTANTVAGSPYAINISFAGDTNYSSAVSVQTKNFDITGATPTLVLTPGPVSSVYGSTTPITITATATGVSGGTTPGGVVTFTTKAAVLGSLSSSTCTLSGGVCTVSYTPSATQQVGNVLNGFSATEAANGNYIASAAATRDLRTTIATGALTMTAGTPGSTTTGVTTTTLIATLSPAASGATVTFTDVTTGATIGSATTAASGVATITVNTAGTGAGQSATPAAGLNNFSASAAATTDTTAASTTSNTATYFQGILFSTVGAHDFSGVITDGALTVEGTIDGTQLGPFGVGIYNFTTTSQALPLTLTNAASGAFSVINQCINPLPAGGVCSVNFYYAPPAGDGCNPNLTPPPAGAGCTLDGAGHPQGTFESAPWSVAVAGGVLTGIGDQMFDRSGAATPSGTLEGKAILAAGVLNVGPTTAAFGSVAQNATSPTITIVVTNTQSAATPFAYVSPSSGHFTANNTCTSPLAANASCNIYLTMVTSATGTFSDSLTITPSGGTVSTVSISGTVALPSSGITLSSNNHNFGSITDGTSVGFSTTLTNNTSGTATLSFSNSAGAGFTTSTNCGASLAASASCTYGFTFAPTTPGASTDTLTITSNVPILPGAGGDTGTVTVNGTGVTGGNLTATSVTHNWGSLAVGTSGGNYGVEITNSSSSAVTLSFSGLTGGSSGFSLVSSTCGASLAVNANCELIFSFTPVATGFVTGTYPITSSSPLYFSGSQVSPEQITLKGTGD